MILICGASGLVGKEMCKLLDSHSIPYIGTYNCNKIDRNNMFKINFNEDKEIEDLLIKNGIKTCIFCVVERLTDVCEKNWDKVKNINIDMVHNTSYICNKLKVKFIHLSTDYVFDGLTQPNYPDSPKNPLQNYGISKLISENRIIKNCKNFLIIRIPVLYSNLSKIHDNAVSLIGKNLMDLRIEEEYREDDFSIRRPLYIPDLCLFIYECLRNNKEGIYHFYNPYNKFTKYQICDKISSIINIDIKKIIPKKNNNTSIAPRPYDTNLKDKKLIIEDYKFSDFDFTLKKHFQKFKFVPINKLTCDDIFLLLDLDGTLIESNNAHYNSYERAFKKNNIDFISLEKWNKIINEGNLKEYIKEKFTEEEVKKIKQEKINELKQEDIKYTKNSDKFIKFLIDNNINFCIVTNTDRETVKIFKQKLPLLNSIKNWICRDDYSKSKPDSECYELACEKFYKGEKEIIGIEDTEIGYKSVSSVTRKIYIFNNIDLFKKQDVYLFNDFNSLL